MLKKIILFSLLLTGTLVMAQGRKHKAIFIIVDGIPADVIERVHTPFLDSIAQKGAYTHAYVGGERGGYSETPTISAPGYNDLLTGTWAYKHNVWGNDISHPNYNYWTLFRVVKESAPSKKLAIFSTWLDNRTKLIGEGLPQTGGIKLDYHFDGMEIDTVLFPHDKSGEFYNAIDEKVVDRATSYARENGPDLSWVYLEYTDEMGHRHGNGSKLDKAVEIADAQVGRIWQAIQYRQDHFAEDWVIYITTDHGRETSGYDHGGQTDRERNTWIVTNAPDINLSIYHHRPAIIDIMPSILSFMKLDIPRDQQMEVDGIPLVGKLSADSPTIHIDKESLVIQWRVLDPSGDAKIWMTSTNNYSTGGKDMYKLMATVPVKNGSVAIPVKKDGPQFYKVVIETPNNMLNRWISLGEPLKRKQ